MSSISKKFAFWGLPNTSKTSFLGNLLHLLKDEATNQNPQFEAIKTYQAFLEKVWPPKLDLEIQLVCFQLENEETKVPYEVYLLDPPGAFLDPNANLMTCPPPFENLSLYQYYAQCDGIIALFDHRTSQGGRAEVEENLGHLFKQLHLINPSAIKPHILYGLTRIHPDSNPSPTQHAPLTYLSNRVIDPQNPIFNTVHNSRRPHEGNTFWVITGFERDNKIENWTGKTFSTREMFDQLLKPKVHPQPPEKLNVDNSLYDTVVHGQPSAGSLPTPPPVSPLAPMPPTQQPQTRILSPLQRPPAPPPDSTPPLVNALPGIPQNPPASEPPASNPPVLPNQNMMPSSHPQVAANYPHGTTPISPPMPPTTHVPQPPPTLPETLPRIFVSHNTLDAPFINPMVDTLRQRGIEVWKAPESILPGEDWVDAIERGLSQSTHVVLVISPSAVESEWVRLEMNTAIRLEREGKIKIIPLNYQPCDVPLLWGNYQAISCHNPPLQVLTDLMRRLAM